MTPGKLARLQFLVRIIDKECRHLETADRRLFVIPMTAERAGSLADDDPDLAERVEAFVGRFGRLQDTLADKLLPARLASALQSGHGFVTTLLNTAGAMTGQLESRGWA